MKTKEKATQLFNKFCYAIGTDRTDSGYYTNIIYAKQCALIAVDEIIEYAERWGDMADDDIKEFEDVKTEIEKL